MEIKGLTAIVTGGASGLGAATAERLAAAGAKVTIFDLNVELGAAHARALGGHFAKVDVIDEASVVQGLDQAEGLHGKARILVNCAGIGPPAKAIGRNGQALPLKDFARIILSTSRPNSPRGSIRANSSARSAPSSSTRRASPRSMARSDKPPIPRRRAASSA